MIALVNYMSQILVELIKLANLIISITKSLACARRIQAVFETRPGMRETAEGPVTEQEDAGEVVFEHVSFTYKNAKEPSLTDIHFSVKKGQTIGIIGGTGSGKSSLVNLIPRFYDVTSGRLLIRGRDAKEYPYAQLRSKIGIVPQKAVLFKGTIADNLRWGKEDATEEEMRKALAAAGSGFCGRKRRRFEYGGAPGRKKELSGGQKQRLTIARALVKDPEILILDDSASALDYATDASLRKAIRSLNPEMTVFIVSQRAASVWNADQIVVLDDGEIAGLGTHQELLETCQVYQEIDYSQFQKEGA